MIIARSGRSIFRSAFDRIGLAGMLASVVVIIGMAAWAYWLSAGLVLSHYDAKAHLVVARRVFDNITPGWKQIGAVWLPLPHLINLLPTQIDFFYRTGIFASLVSITSFGITAWASARMVLHLTGSRVGALTATALLALNPNLLYLQSTPMTEPLLLATTFVAVLWLTEWVEQGRTRVPRRLGIVLAAAAWTRYEAWPILVAALVLTHVAIWRATGSLRTANARAGRLASWPIAAVLVFLCISRLTVGHWFVTGGFYVADPLYARQVIRSIVAVWWGTHRLGGYLMELAGLAALLALCLAVIRGRAAASRLIPAAVVACAALPAYAFYSGHPFRIRYMIPSVAACALLSGLGIGAIACGWSGGERLGAPRMGGVGRRGLAGVAALLLIVATMIQSPPWSRTAPMILEAQWDRPDSIGRRAVTACLAPNYRGDKVMVSMGSLAHYMQELSASGFAIADFLNEGNGTIWNLALETGPAPHAGWMLVEETAEGGDVLAQRIHRDPTFTRGMVKVCEGGGVALYRRE